MKHQQRIGSTVIVALVVFVLSGVLVRSQGGAPTRFLTPPVQVVAIRAGRLFDSRTGAMLANQVVLIRGDRIADVYDALTSDRPYRKAMSPFDAKEIIVKGAAIDFDPVVVDAFVAAFRFGEMDVRSEVA